jgi:hypothetical protein
MLLPGVAGTVTFLLEHDYNLNFQALLEFQNRLYRKSFNSHASFLTFLKTYF